MAFDLYSKGYSIKKVTDMLNEKGCKTKRGNSFKNNSMYDLLHNPKYIGNYIFGVRRKDENTRQTA
jgi:site-specific DNA recombinase